MRRVVTHRHDGTELDFDASLRRDGSHSSDSQGPYSKRLAWSNFDSHVSACSDSLRSQSFTLPWETGLCGMVVGRKMPKLFQAVGDDPSQVGRADFLRGVTNVAHELACKPLLPKLPGHVRQLKLMSWYVEPDDLKRRAIGMIRIMIESDLSATQLGKMLHDMAFDLANESSIQQLLQDTFARKSPATLYKRARSFWKYFEWMKGSYGQSLHLDEEKLYRYICHLRDSNAAPTSSQAFIESLNFFKGLWGFSACNVDTIVSPRVKGAVYSMLLKKRPLMQARPLRVEEVKALESLVIEPTCEILGVMAGFFLFCIYNCCRFSDAQNAASLDLDVDGGVVVLHSGTHQHKTATTADKKTTLLPLVCLGNFLKEEPWATAWLLLMQGQSWNEERTYLLPAYNELSGSWADRRMTSGEGTLWLRACLAARDIDVLDDVKRPTTHSCKATVLSWLAKAGNFDMSERQIIGHHLDRPSTSALTYGRQNFIPILVKVAAMLKRIVDGTFNPDAQASRMVRAALASMELESAAYQEQMGIAATRDDFEDSASDVDDQEDLEIDVNQIVPPAERRLVQLAQPELFEQHRIFGILHLISNDIKFACGRTRTANYLPPEADCTLGSPVCEQCRASPLFSGGVGS